MLENIRKTDYAELCRMLESLIVGVPHETANLANASALLFDKIDGINWAGFYLYEKEKLVLNAFQGKPACIEIPLGKGVCGHTASTLQTTVVGDVHKFSGHIACDSASNSEIVIPLIVKGKLYGVLDIDSPIFERFSDEDKTGLERFAKILCNQLETI